MPTKPMTLFAIGLAMAALSAPAAADPIRIVAAENFYGDIAKQIGGEAVEVTSILTNPDQDPHLFEASPETARDLVGARVVIANGAGYDAWIDKLIAANATPGRKEIVVGPLVGRRAGDNPHLWYHPGYVKAMAKALAVALVTIDPAHRSDYGRGEAQFVASLEPIEAKIAEMRKKYAGRPIIASEPVFGYQAELIGLKVHNEKFAWAIMNDAEPTVSEVASFEDDLKGHHVDVMLFNAQASEPAVQRLVDLAKGNAIPIVGVAETEPPGSTYQAWMLAQLDALDRALAKTTK